MVGAKLGEGKEPPTCSAFCLCACNYVVSHSQTAILFRLRLHERQSGDIRLYAFLVRRYKTTLSTAILLAEVVGWERDYFLVQ